MCRDLRRGGKHGDTALADNLVVEIVGHKVRVLQVFDEGWGVDKLGSEREATDRHHHGSLSTCLVGLVESHDHPGAPRNRHVEGREAVV